MNIEYPVQVCFVNCGLSGEQCACFRAQMQAFRAGLSKQEPLPADFAKVWDDNLERLYQS